MNKIISLYKKELNSYFSSPIAYIFIMIFLVITGYLFWVIIYETRQAMMRDVFGVMGSVLLFITPMLTMRLFAEEKKTGTIELLLTSPISSTTLVLGKFLATCTIFIIMFFFTLSYPIILAALGNPELLPILSGYLGILFMVGCFTSVGLFSSILTENQLIAGVICFGILLGFLVIDWTKTFVTNPIAQSIIKNISFFEHYEGFRKGVIAFPDFVYFGSFMFLFLFATIQILEVQSSQ